MTHKLAFIGFGVVGRGLAEILLQKRDFLRDRCGFDYSIVAIADLMHGSVFHADGLDPLQLLSHVEDGRSFNDFPEGTKGWDSLTTIRDSNADVVVEVTFTDVQTGEPAISHCRAAFESGKHVVTTNKGPVALAAQELMELATANGREFKFEGTVMSGTPVLNTAQVGLAGCTVERARGIMNGTTNFMLSEMESGRSYDEALQTAQKRGYAEADPTADVEGWDVLAKVLILGNVLMGGDLRVGDVARQGITALSPENIAAARSEDCRWKLIGQVQQGRDGIQASVQPVKLPLSDPLASVGGVTIAITLETDLAGPVTIIGAGAGKRETGYALLSDLLQIHRNT